MKQLSDLIDYIQDDLGPDQIDQLVIILHLLRNGGRATRVDLAASLLQYNEVAKTHYDRVLAQATDDDFAYRDMFSVDNKTDNYFLNVHLPDAYAVEKAVKLCQSKIDAWRGAKENAPTQSLPTLVRDRVPEQLRAAGHEPLFEALDGEALRGKLIDKLAEIYTHLWDAPDLDTLADAYEVLDVIAEKLGHDPQAVRDTIRQRREQDGSYREGMYLKTLRVRTPSDSA